MDYNYTLKYRTFDSLLEDVKMDLRNLSADTSIEPAQLIKVARNLTILILHCGFINRLSLIPCGNL